MGQSNVHQIVENAHSAVNESMQYFCDNTDACSHLLSYLGYFDTVMLCRTCIAVDVCVKQTATFRHIPLTDMPSFRSTEETVQFLTRWPCCAVLSIDPAEAGNDDYALGAYSYKCESAFIVSS
jgi:hypothetical protein